VEPFERPHAQIGPVGRDAVDIGVDEELPGLLHLQIEV
jgi:hypothetical protein